MADRAEGGDVKAANCSWCGVQLTDKEDDDFELDFCSLECAEAYERNMREWLADHVAPASDMANDD